MAEKDNQHLVPSTFLKQFVIKDYKTPKHVWCIDFYDKYNNDPKPKGVNSSVFKIKNFYSLNSQDFRLILENFYSDKLEPEYNKIMAEINDEKDLSEIIRIRLIEWLFHSNQRTEFFRKNTKRVTKFIMEMTLQFEKNKQQQERDLTANEIEFIDKESYKIAKEVQIDNILDNANFDKSINLFIDELKIKKWSILKTNVDYPFIANDNPGFSLNLSHLNRDRLFNPTIHLNHPSFNYLVLSPKYCLYIEPFKQNDPINLNAFNIKIEYKKISNDYVDFINQGTFMTSLRYIISNNLETISKWQNKN